MRSRRNHGRDAVPHLGVPNCAVAWSNDSTGLNPIRHICRLCHGLFCWGLGSNGWVVWLLSAWPRVGVGCLTLTDVSKVLGCGLRVVSCGQSHSAQAIMIMLPMTRRLELLMRCVGSAVHYVVTTSIPGCLNGNGGWRLALERTAEPHARHQRPVQREIRSALPSFCHRGFTVAKTTPDVPYPGGKSSYRQAGAHT